MSNLIVSSINSKNSVGKVAITNKSTESFVAQTSNIDNKSKVKKYILPTTLIAGGGLLLYFGLSKPDKVKAFKKFYKQNKFAILNEKNSFLNNLEVESNNLNSQATNIASKYVANNGNINLKNVLTAMEAYNNPKDILKLLETCYLALYKPQRAGASEMDTLLCKYLQEKRLILGRLGSNKHQRILVIKDYRDLPKFETTEHDELYDKCKTDIDAYAKSVIEEVETIFAGAFTKEDKANYKKLAKTILSIRDVKTYTKENLIRKAYEQINRLYHLEERLSPKYQYTQSVEAYNKLTKEQKALTLLPPIDEDFSHSYYLNIVSKMNFNKLDDTKLLKIFSSIPHNENLQDLKYLLDRLRLARFVEAQEKTQNVELYDVAIAKLEFLSSSLENLGNNELLSALKVDFTGMNTEKTRATLSKINSITKKFGFNSFEQMDKYMLSKYPEYSEASFHLNLQKFLNAPEMYFM